MSDIITKKFPYIAFALFLILEVCVFLSNKMVSDHATGYGMGFYLGLLSQPWIWASLLLASAQFFFWTAILQKAELGHAYSMSSLSYPLTMLAAGFVFNEHLPPLVWVGGGLITLGVIIIGWDAK